MCSSSEAGVKVLFTHNGSEEQSVNLHSISLQSELCVCVCVLGG